MQICAIESWYLPSESTTGFQQNNPAKTILAFGSGQGAGAELLSCLAPPLLVVYGGSFDPKPEARDGM